MEEVNFFNRNLDGFINAYKVILSECVVFNKVPVSDDPTRPLMFLANNFSMCDKEMISYAYPVTINRDGKLIDTIAEIKTDGTIEFL